MLPDKKGRYPLHWSVLVEKSDTNVVKHLLAGVDKEGLNNPDHSKRTALYSNFDIPSDHFTLRFRLHRLQTTTS